MQGRRGERCERLEESSERPLSSSEDWSSSPVRGSGDLTEVCTYLEGGWSQVGSQDWGRWAQTEPQGFSLPIRNRFPLPGEHWHRLPVEGVKRPSVELPKDLGTVLAPGFGWPCLSEELLDDLLRSFQPRPLGDSVPRAPEHHPTKKGSHCPSRHCPAGQGPLAHLRITPQGRVPQPAQLSPGRGPIAYHSITP